MLVKSLLVFFILMLLSCIGSDVAVEGVNAGPNWTGIYVFGSLLVINLFALVIQTSIEERNKIGGRRWLE